MLGNYSQVSSEGVKINIPIKKRSLFVLSEIAGIEK